MILLLIIFCFFIIGYDLLFRRVPNSFLLSALLVHIGYMVVTGSGVLGVDVKQSLIGAGVALIGFVPLYALRVMGAGDVKLLILLGALFGLAGLFAVWVMGSLIAGLHAVAFYTSRIWFGFVPPGLYRVLQNFGDGNLYQRVLSARQGRKGAPYAAYLAVAVLVYVGMTWRGQ